MSSNDRSDPAVRDASKTASRVSVSVEVDLHGATLAARAEFNGAVQAYADFLAAESQKQELSLRTPGVLNLEVTASAVVRARRAISRYGKRAKPRLLESTALAGAPIFSGATGVMGSYLDGLVQISVFAGLAFMAVLCIGYLVFRRLS